MPCLPERAFFQGTLRSTKTCCYTRAFQQASKLILDFIKQTHCHRPQTLIPILQLYRGRLTQTFNPSLASRLCGTMILLVDWISCPSANSEALPQCQWGFCTKTIFWFLVHSSLQSNSPECAVSGHVCSACSIICPIREVNSWPLWLC